jgi:GNAT superfamily N-acetyltransferase
MTSDSIAIARASLVSPESLALIGALNAELSAAHPEPGACHFQLDPAEVTGDRGVFLIIYREGEPVGCGALRVLDDETGEFKRMYVVPAVRGNGLGKRLVAALEAEAGALGVRRLVLETGVRLTAAVALYRSMGFEQIPLYGEYLSSPDTSLCMGKDLTVAAP